MSGNKTYQTILVICLGLVVLAVLAHVQPVLWLAVAVGVVALISEKLARLIERGWMIFSETLGKIMSRLLLSLIFFIILTPLALVYRLLGKDGLSLKPAGGNSLFKTRDHQYRADDLEKPW